MKTGHLEHQRQARRERVDVVFLVERHELRLLLLLRSSRDVLPLYLFWSCFTFGWMRCMAAIERNCLIVSGSIASRTVTVSSTIDQPHETPSWSW